MLSSDNLKSTVATTARWTAAVRAEESNRPDAHFHDRFARQFAGEGPAPTSQSSWPLVARTQLIDEAIARSVSEGADRVLNLAAGFDTRPYRLALPSTLRWFEADVAPTLEEKARLLAHEKPACEIERHPVDLTDPSALSELLDRALDGARNGCVVTEGLILYLTAEQVSTLAEALASRPQIRSWILDLASPATLAMLQRTTDPLLEPESRMKFAPAEGTDFFERAGWRVSEVSSLMRKARKMKRLPPLLSLVSFLPEPRPNALGTKRWGGVVRLRKAG